MNNVAKTDAVETTVVDKPRINLANGEEVGRALAAGVQKGVAAISWVGDYLSGIKRGYKGAPDPVKQHCLDVVLKMENKETFTTEIPGGIIMDVKDGVMVGLKYK